ncbi:hypothetical protein BCR41DRAFT_190065 [Lobosporangium transversale]|uniref:Uncharacterized protein n=1 Tax=Lobosporangium transversale TaxID=64571 RepID=A0A1Y2GA18_9FUNG|nr:hypothetical protein BCR41DRAFT_190065 [Lobosporangium transversale]ORZ05193.1 hypothetical protein BCR41DRAFT_190065 [Lobosporangium transversale]|eukprot:XP_021876968.1 hypothetical protein BCR41DRAFT_190065 [Lobosporangium transversale]
MSFSEEEESPDWYIEKGWHFDQNNDFVDKEGRFFDFESQQEHYEYVQLMIRRHIFDELQRRFDFYPIYVPATLDLKLPAKTVVRRGPRCPQVYATKDYRSNPKLMVIVQGLGEVPPGQWARKLFTNGKRGQWGLATQFPYIERALAEKWAIILCDPNHDEGKPKNRKTRALHVQRVWEDLIRAGTTATLDLYEAIKLEFNQRVQAIAFLDGEVSRADPSTPEGEWFAKHSRSFRKQSLDVASTNEETVATSDHDSVPGIAVKQVFRFLKAKVDQFDDIPSRAEVNALNAGPSSAVISTLSSSPQLSEPNPEPSDYGTKDPSS